MKIAAASMTALALVAAAGSATPSFAHDYRGYGYGYADQGCREQQHQSGTTGALLGGVAGALLGSSLASDHGNRTGGAAIGAVAGALLGSSLGRSSAKSSDVCQMRDARQVSYRGYAPYAPQPRRVWTGYDPYSY